MQISVNMSQEVAEYFKNYDMDKVIDTLLDMYDFTNLPAVYRPRYTFKTVNVTNEAYLSLYNTLGPRNKKVSLSRLVEFAYDMDVLTLPRFEAFHTTSSVSKDKQLQLAVYDAYRSLLRGRKYCADENISAQLDIVIRITHNFYKQLSKEV